MKDSSVSAIQVRTAIHFDQLWQQALSDLGYYARSSWSDTADHDPGVTLLQGLSYAVSDLAYRHTLPLTDLLTPEQQNGDGLFPASFGPHQTLTGAPVTADDYRRAILDLRSSDGSDSFYFRDAQLLLLDENSEKNFGYWYNFDDREFYFRRSYSDKTPPQLFILHGGYKLLVELNRGVKQADAEPVLRAFLAESRNVCEVVGQITWLQPQDVNVELVLELEDDFSDPAQLLANTYTILEAYLSPQAKRFSAAQLTAQGLSCEEIYQGPRLQHGWITELPTPRDYGAGYTLNINPLANALLAMDGVKHLETLEFLSEGWETSLPAGMSVRLWGEDPLQVLAQGVQVKLMKRGQQMKATKAQIEQALPNTALINEKPVLLPYGRYRNPGRYYSVSDTIPPCYGLQQSPPGAQAQQLYQFLLTFEQLLANGCDQLANLPQLLAFDRDTTEDAHVTGGQWPFIDGALANTVHADYSDALKQWIKQQRQDFDKELSIIGHLLGYFGDQRSNRTLLESVSEEDFLTIQRGYLKQYSTLGYARSQFSKSTISAIQRRIAARLGVGKELFVDTPDIDLRNLPFYLIENISLLPQEPDIRYDDLQPLNALAVDDTGVLSWLMLTVDDEVTGLQPGLLIDLVIPNPNNDPFTISSCMVANVIGNTLYLDVNDNPQLLSSLALLLDAQQQKTLRWCNSMMWLEDMTYELTYVPGQAADETCPWITTEPFPRDLQKNDTIAIYLDSTTDHASQKTYATVVEVNAINQALRIEWQSGPALTAPALQLQYRWYVVEAEINDRFSFNVSVVFNSDLLANATDPNVVEAWIKKVIQDELPCHVSASLLWLSDAAFKDFSWAYTRWQTTRRSHLGLLSYYLMRLLALGMLPKGGQGIDAMRIATEEQQTRATSPDWDFDYIKSQVLLYTPPV
ncbi:hypothetical protein J3D48_006223 [Pseudomonas fluorescens]|uniref:hypothetical protein n=1 Tax=Pseudomonas fluorescens TaxID=294 RepID=UPI00209EBA57|nr:hypothetical protein [Pseudomonas fluorescens]MCP1489813.1 hypothetical protein [Pseudomonas fluorescens]